MDVTNQTVSNKPKFCLTSGNKPIKDLDSRDVTWELGGGGGCPFHFCFAKVPGPKTVRYFFHTVKYYVYIQYIFVWTTVLIGVGPETQRSLIRAPLWSHTW